MTDFQVFFNWLFDGNSKSEIPKPKYDDNGKVIVPDILKYNSPITSQYVIRIFANNPNLNHYLNIYLNNINLWYIDKAELLMFLKKCVMDFKVRRNSIPFIKRSYKDKLFNELRKKLPTLKNYDISLLCNLIQKRDDKDSIYNSLGLEKPKKTKFKKSKDNVEDNNVVSLKKFLEDNFKVVRG